MGEENVIFENKGEKLSGVLHTPEVGTKSAILFCHGFAGDKNGYKNKNIRVARKLCANGFAVLRFDLRGCGASDGKFVDTTISSEADDLRAAIDFVQKLGYERIGVIGGSFGGFVSILANDPRVKSMVLWAPVLTLKEAFIKSGKVTQQMINEALTKGYTVYKRSAGGEVELSGEFVKEITKLEIFDIIKKISYPLMIIHGNKDQIVDYRYSEKYIRYAVGQKQLRIIPGADHDFTTDEYDQQLTEATVEWFIKWLK
jgi:hypothetical protein